MKKVTAIVLIVCILFMTPGSAFAAEAETITFTETCASNPTQPLNTSTTITVGTSWSSRITLFGTAATTINSGTANCSALADSTDDGFGYTMTPAPNTNIYYVDFVWTDGGTVPVTSNVGVLLNYIDASNYYACTFHDDATPEVVVYKVSSGVGSLVAATSTNQTISSGNVVKCHIDYSGANPTFTVTNTTTSTQLYSATDSSSPLTKTKKAGFMCGALPTIGPGFDCESALDTDTIRQVDVYTNALAGQPRFLRIGTMLLLSGKLILL